MTVYRIAKKQYINDLSGEGARLYGGRWNRKGSRVLYTSESRSLATVEFLVHVPIQIMPKELYIAEIEINDILPEVIDVKSLEGNWTEYPSPESLMDIGEEWKVKRKSLCLKVPSAVIKNEWNVLINPEHDGFKNVKIVSIEEYIFDARLLNRN